MPTAARNTRYVPGETPPDRMTDAELARELQAAPGQLREINDQIAVLTTRRRSLSDRVSAVRAQQEERAEGRRAAQTAAGSGSDAA